MRTPEEIAATHGLFRLVADMGAGINAPAVDVAFNVMAADALEWVLGGEPAKFMKSIAEMRALLVELDELQEG